jgi:hypothetical protein
MNTVNLSTMILPLIILLLVVIGFAGGGRKRSDSSFRPFEYASGNNPVANQLTTFTTLGSDAIILVLVIALLAPEAVYQLMQWQTHNNIGLSQYRIFEYSVIASKIVIALACLSIRNKKWKYALFIVMLASVVLFVQKSTLLQN